MTDHDELVNAGSQAMHNLFNQPGIATNREFAAAVVRAVEPLIREDEWDHIEALDSPYLAKDPGVRAMVLADLHAQVMALPDEHHYGPADKNRCVKRADVLALLGEDTP